MSLTKRWLEDISVEMGEGGYISEKVIQEGTRRLKPKRSPGKIILTIAYAFLLLLVVGYIVMICKP